MSEDIVTRLELGAAVVLGQGKTYTAKTMEEAAATIATLRADKERLERENHNLNWALGSTGYEQMATPEEQAEHEAGMSKVSEMLDRMKAAKEAHEAMERDAARYRWLRDHDMTLEYCEYITGNLNGRGVDPLDLTVDAAMKEQP